MPKCTRIFSSMEGLPLLGAEDRAIDVVGWLRRLELEHAITGRAGSGETLFDS